MARTLGTYHLVAADGWLYFTDEAAVMSIPVGGGTGAVLNQDAGRIPSGVAADELYVYWVDLKGGAAILRAPTTGGSSTVLAVNQGYVSAIVSDGAYVYWASSSSAWLPRTPIALNVP
jgi:hypothetical protein